jgi:hypothetical protein
VVDRIERDLKKLRRFPLLKPGIASRLDGVDAVTVNAFTLGVNWDGVFRPIHKESGNDTRQ